MNFSQKWSSSSNPSEPQVPINGGKQPMAAEIQTLPPDKPIVLVDLLRSKEPVRVRITVTPSMAKFLLESTNVDNPRKLSDSHVYKIFSDLIEGRWVYNGVPIVISRDRVLLDGQHRLRACVEAEVQMDTDLIFGMDPRAVVTYDINLVRTAGVLAKLQHIPNSNGACAMAKLLLIHERGGIHRLNNKSIHPSKPQILERASSDRRLQQIPGRTHGWSAGLVNPRVINFCYYLFSAQNETAADRFFRDFREGDELSRTSPVFQLRKKLIANSRSKAKLPMLEIIALFFKAWAAYRENQPMGDLRWRSLGPSPEKFPTI